MRDPMVQLDDLMKNAVRAGTIQPGEDLAAWQTAARARLETLLGLPFERCDEQFKIEWQKECGEYTERSTGSYNNICNYAFMVMGYKQNRK